MYFTILMLVFAATLPSSNQTHNVQPLPQSAFAYDSAAPLNIKTIAQHRSEAVVIREISFASDNGRRIHAQLAAPAHIGQRHGAVLFVHWLGDPKTTNLTEFSQDALALAHQGCVSLLIDAMWSQPNWYERIRLPSTDYAKSLEQVVDLRRSIDLLEQQPGVDQRRIAFVGHDFGAMYGAVLSGVDARPRGTSSLRVTQVSANGTCSIRSCTRRRTALRMLLRWHASIQLCTSQNRARTSSYFNFLAAMSTSRSTMRCVLSVRRPYRAVCSSTTATTV